MSSLSPLELIEQYWHILHTDESEIETLQKLEANMQEIRVKVNQIELQIREYEQDGDAIIFLYFSGVNLMMWQRIIPYFQDHYHLVMVDIRGHGKSDKPETGYHIDEMAHDIVGVMAYLKLERAHIVGSSLGVEVGLSMAANYPEKVISLVCEGALYSEYGPYGIWEGSETDFEEYVASQLEKILNTPETVSPSVDALVDDVSPGSQIIPPGLALQGSQASGR